MADFLFWKKFNKKEQLKHEAELKEEAMKQARNEFYSRLNLELRTPINNILGLSEMLIRENKSPEVLDYAMNIQNEGQILVSFLNDIYDAAKLEDGKIVLSESGYDLSSILTDCVNIAGLRIKEKGLELRIENDPETPKLLKGDSVRIRQIISNLLSNAVKYTTVGYVLLSIDWEKETDFSGKLCISVKDTGMGISEEKMPTLFDSFERFDDRTKTYKEGTSLGLCITKKLVELMGGSIKAESRLDEGSVFTVTIPQEIISYSPIGDFAKLIAERNKIADTATERFTAPDASILVVDDVKMNIDVFRGLLKKTQIKIDAALSGKEAIEMAIKKKYDIIFMDHYMPEMSGVETLKKLKVFDTLNDNTPVVALTANADEGADEEYRALGFAEYVLKPVKGKVLEEVIIKYLKKEEEA